MLTATGITAFAETTNVSYNVDPSYTVAIPAAVTLGDAAVTADITASDVILESGKKIKVDLTAASNTASGSTFNAKNGDSAVTYTITGDKAIAVGDTVATFAANGSKTLTFSAANKSAATVAGSHTETLTFTISVAAPETKNISFWGQDYLATEGDTWQDFINATAFFNNNGYVSITYTSTDPDLSGLELQASIYDRTTNRWVNPNDVIDFTHNYTCS
jgi:hypothetical protein